MLPSRDRGTDVEGEGVVVGDFSMDFRYRVVVGVGGNERLALRNGIEDEGGGREGEEGEVHADSETVNEEVSEGGVGD